MSKLVFSILVILMSLSLIGIIFAQAYYINNILQIKEKQDVVIITLMSLLFTLIIIVGYMSAVYQLIKQRKISQMKSDFINNMTHEFKFILNFHFFYFMLNHFKVIWFVHLSCKNNFEIFIFFI